jgi:hypothetical protein
MEYDAKNPKWDFVDEPATPTVVGGEPALVYAFTFSAKNKANPPVYTGRRWEVHHDGVEFALTGDANAAHRAEIDAIIASVTFLR